MSKFRNQPLSEVVETLGRMAGVNVYLDPQGLHAEGVTTDEPISINLTEPISLRSALNLILEPLHLSYVIQNEVLRITSEQTRDSDTFVRVYNVADLVIPIPNFVPSYNIGLPGALREAMNSTGQVRPMGSYEPVALTLAANDNSPAAAANASVLAQMGTAGMLPSATSRTPTPSGLAPGSMGGASMADFDTLIDLITSTIAPQSWDLVGGPGSIEGFPTNLSLVVSQTQEIHEQIADLLDQLRRLQDLQVTIEVRFITLNDRFFERIGIDFDFNVNDNSNQIAGQNPVIRDNSPALLRPGPHRPADGRFRLSIPAGRLRFGHSAVRRLRRLDRGRFRIRHPQRHRSLLPAASRAGRRPDQRAASPEGHAVQRPDGLRFGHVPAAVRDERRPGGRRLCRRPSTGGGGVERRHVAKRPGRRFARPPLRAVDAGAVLQFDRQRRHLHLHRFPVLRLRHQHRRSRPTRASTVRNNERDIISGTTVQLPTFNFTTVSTTVSVPDGGTVLLGGIKRLSEGRNERGVPMLSKVPYINRLFRNVGIGRDTQA
jgi:general secretion pathway protein D